MKRYLAPLTIALCVSIATSALAKNVPVFRAGAAAIDISPRDFPVNMPGGFSANFAEKNHDPLHARAIVLDDGSIAVAIVLVDNLGISRDTLDIAKSLAAKKCGIPPERMLISSTHTHTAPSASVTQGPPASVAYREIVIDGIVQAITKAHDNLRPAMIGAAAHPLPEEVFNRRWFLKPGEMPLNPFGEIDLVKMNPGTSPKALLHPAGPIDPDVSVIAINDAKSRRPLAIYANYSLHYVGGVPPGQVSADYFGEFARLMPFRVNAGADFVAMMSNGTSGDINNIPFIVGRPPREPFEQIRIVAGKAADAAWHARNAISQYHSDARLGMLQREIGLKTRKPSAEQIAWAKSILAMSEEERAKQPRLAEAYARRTLALAEADETTKVLLQAIRIGPDIAVCAIPFETFAETGLDLKKRSPFPRTIVVSIANGYHGYLPTPEQHKLGGYETWLGTNRVEKDASVIISNHLLEMLAELAKSQ